MYAYIYIHVYIYIYIYMSGMIEYKMVNTGANKGYVSDGTKVRVGST